MVKKILSLEIIGLMIMILNITPLFSTIHYKLSEYSEIIVLDVGQGDSILFKNQKGQFGLIDTGKNKSVISSLEKYIPQNNRVLEFVILSHADQDHIGMFTEISKRYQIKNFFMSKTPKTNKTIETIQQDLVNQNIPNYSLFSDSDFRFGEFEFNIIWPIYGSLSKDFETNEYSTSTLISIGEFNFLTMGDIGTLIEDDIYQYLPKDNIEILKLSHHGSKNSSGEEFLRYINPAITLISAGKNNSYGHPSKETIERLSLAGKKHMSTIEEGDIIIRIDKLGKFTIN